MSETADALKAAALRMTNLIRAHSPGIGDDTLFRVMVMAAGVALANAAFPAMPHPDDATGAGALLCMGVQLGRDERTRLEKESCKGAA